MTWTLQRVLDLIELIVGWFYTRKYGAMARRFGRSFAEDDGTQGLLIVQIDGLAHETLLEAIGQGVMPYVGRLIDRDHYRLHPWWCGVPSSTPAVQGGLMYGNSWNVPAFRWYEKSSGRFMVSKNPRDARLLRDRLSQDRVGLLTDGSSYFNVLDGGARLALFTISSLGGARFFENVRGLGFALLMLLSPLRLLRTAATVIWEFLRDLWQRLVSRFDTKLGRRRRSFSPFASLLQIFASVVFRELTSFGVMLDIYRGVPSVYANFYGYDEVAHQLGPLDNETARVLRGIDRRIREIDAARRRFASRRPYDLFIMSDHGMSACTPFKELYGQTLGQMLASLVEDGNQEIGLDEAGSEPLQASREVAYLLDELQGIQANLPLRGQRLAAALHAFAASRVVVAEDMDWDLSRQGDLILRNSGTISLVYFTVTPQQMDLSEIELIYPGLLRHLVEHPGLGLVLGRERGEAMVMTLRGPRRLASPNQQLVRALLHDLPDPQVIGQQLCRLMSFPASGDLVILGQWNSQGHVVAFEPHWATHGGLGGAQNHAFMLAPSNVPWNISSITSPEQFYPLFSERYGRGRTDGNTGARSDLTKG